MPLALALLCLLAPLQETRESDWTKALRDVAALDPDDRAAAREALMRRAALNKESLRRLAREDDQALIVLGVLGDPAARPGLVRLLRSESPAVRAIVAEAMSWAPGEHGLTELGARLEDGDLAVAMAAARALGRSRAKGAESILKKVLGGKDERRALIAAHGLEVREPGSMTSFIKQRMGTDISWIIASNAESVAAALGRDFVTESTPNGPSFPYKRDERLKAEFETASLSGAREDAYGTFLVRSGILHPTDVLAYLSKEGPRTEWALARAPKMRGLRQSCLAHELVKLLEGRGKSRPVDGIEAILNRFAGKKPEGDLSERAGNYREWWTRARAGMIDADVARAIDDGVDWLRRRQEQDGSWRWCACGFGPHSKSPHFAGMTALAGYTLLKMDVPGDDPAVVRAADYLLDMPVEKVTDNPTYSLSLQAMFLGELLPKLKSGKGRDPHLAARALKRVQECVDWLVESRIEFKDGEYERYVWTYGRPAGTPNHDHSNTQFAVLGLLAGQNAGVRAPLKIWQGIYNHWRTTQFDEGGWYYTPPSPETPKASRVGSTSMTGAGLSSLLIGAASTRRVATEKACADEEGAARALAKWERAYPIPEPARYGGPGHVFSVYYDLYSVERALMLGGVKKVGGRDWYHDGALYILWNQMYDGAWLDTSDTCFALLFLKRAYVPVASGDSSK